ncbi:hypothetical protein HZU72_17705 [Halomonas sp. QX-2]|uniref:Uncharacterized protein n=1 Tax=Vreelandella sedimenti TaxID=2729618 RepID=A0A7Z0N9Q5_9GAMM|nr:hypothetical protein [Halomonas sedimenti]NYT74249.1 hypothetical protein [Halomonas sedimenti]
MIYSAPDSSQQQRANTAALRLAGLQSRDIEKLARDSAMGIAQELMKHQIPIPSKKIRPDVGNVQIDMIIIEEKVSAPEPGMRLQFDVEGGMGVTFTIKLLEFLQDPKGYVTDLFTQLGPMRRNIQRMRTHKRAADAAIYRALTQGAANG